MSLDKWVNSKQKPIKKQEKNQKSEEVGPSETKVIKQSGKLKKYLLKCPKSKCNYQKTILKTLLSERDIICSRCKSKMKIEEL
ncbi:MAG: hypothetical protein KGD63_05495 [Candidatus Lokiarchaeota archaeon]|nr:hypothetical protein [Candidatus Lokiarchaeota archaeon]